MATSPTGFKFRLDPKKLLRPEPLPQAIYKLRLTGFAPKNAKIKANETVSESINFNPIFTMDAPGKEYDQREFKYLYSCNSKIESWIQDMVHACGLIMEDDGAIPGNWASDKAKFNPKDASTWVYSGPLLNQSLEAEINIQPDLQGIPQNRIFRFVCRVPDCATRFPKIQHSKGMKSSS